MLRTTLIHQIQWADQICILDLGSKDGTQSFCRSVLRPQDVYIRREKNTIPTLGFSEAMNAIMAVASMDWIYVAGASYCLDWKQREMVKPTLASATRDVLDIETQHIPITTTVHQIEEITETELPTRVERHRVFVRRGSGIVYKGYIHEELFLGETNVVEMADVVPLRRFHFSKVAQRQTKQAYMIIRAYHNPELQAYTNKWWYTVFVPENFEYLTQLASECEKELKENGDI